MTTGFNTENGEINKSKSQFQEKAEQTAALGNRLQRGWQTFSLLSLQQRCMRKMNKTAEEHRKEFGFGTGEKELYVRKKKKSAPSAEHIYSRC